MSASTASSQCRTCLGLKADFMARSVGAGERSCNLAMHAPRLARCFGAEWLG